MLTTLSVPSYVKDVSPTFGKLSNYFYDRCVKPNPGWKKKFSEVKRSRLLEANQDLDPKEKDSEKKARQFERQLQYGERWARLRREFGPGIYALLPSTVVTNRWIEQQLSITHFDAWLSVLRRHNPPDPLIAERAWYLVEEALSGQPPPERLRLEDTSFADLGRDCRDPSILLPLVDVQDGAEDESFDKDGAFLEEEDIVEGCWDLSRTSCAMFVVLFCI
jgi:hypothetical protein